MDRPRPTQVDLASIEPLRDHLGLDAPGPKKSDGELGRPVQRYVFLFSRATPLDEHRSVSADLEDLRAPVKAQVQPSPTRRSGPKLPVDVCEMGAASDEDVDP